MNMSQNLKERRTHMATATIGSGWTGISACRLAHSSSYFRNCDVHPISMCIHGGPHMSFYIIIPITVTVLEAFDPSTFNILKTSSENLWTHELFALVIIKWIIYVDISYFFIFTIFITTFITLKGCPRLNEIMEHTPKVKIIWNFFARECFKPSIRKTDLRTLENLKHRIRLGTEAIATWCISVTWEVRQHTLPAKYKTFAVCQLSFDTIDPYQYPFLLVEVYHLLYIHWSYFF